MTTKLFDSCIFPIDKIFFRCYKYLWGDNGLYCIYIDSLWSMQEKEIVQYCSQTFYAETPDTTSKFWWDGRI